MTFKIAIAAAAFVAVAAPAAALEVKTQGNHAFRDSNNANAWYTKTAYQLGAQTIDPVFAGLFRLQLSEDGGNLYSDFLAFCLQPLETLSLPKTHTETTSLAQSVVDDLNALATNVWGQIDINTTTATNAEKTVAKNAAVAMQMAVWEIANETGAYDIDAGHFAITGTSGASDFAENIAQGYLDNITTGAWTAGPNAVRIFSAPGTQDLLTNLPDPGGNNNNVDPVPLPATGLMLLAGLGVLAARRKLA